MLLTHSGYSIFSNYYRFVGRYKIVEGGGGASDNDHKGRGLVPTYGPISYLFLKCGDATGLYYYYDKFTL